MSAPLISVVLPSRNGVAHLAEAVGSVVGQTWKDWELVLVNDGSSDDTGARMDALAARDERIRVVHLPENRGLPAALNEGFRHARGALFSWTSDDNLYLPDALERLQARLEQEPALDLVYADYWTFGDGLPEQRVRVRPVSLLPLKSVVGACFLYRRELHEELGGFDEGLFLAEDYDFWLRASLRFQLAPLHEPLYRYRVHAGSLSARRRVDAFRAAVRALERHLPGLDPAMRAHASMVRAGHLFALDERRAAFRLVRRALAEAPAVALRPQHRRTLSVALLGRRGAHLVGRALGRQAARRVRLIAPEALDGLAPLALHLARTRPRTAPPLDLLWLRDARERGAGAAAVERPAVGRRVEHRGERLSRILRRLHRVARSGSGVLVASERIGLAYAARYGGERAVVQILLGEPEADAALAARFEPWIDLFIAVGAPARDALVARVPERRDDVCFVPGDALAAAASLHELLTDLSQPLVRLKPRWRRQATDPVF